MIDLATDPPPTPTPTPAERAVRPDFVVLGAQKCGTTWLWRNLAQHPETDLPRTKEIHYFGGVEKYRQGDAWYYAHFDGLDPDKLVGEASTTYFYDLLTYWYNPSEELVTEPSLPSIPELVTRELPDARFLVILRDPVKRAVSAYKHWLRKQFREQGGVSPRKGLRRTALEHPKMRILEMGYYERYLAAWQAVVPPERLRVYIFEEDVIRNPERTFRDLCEFLGIDPGFVPADLRAPVHKSWGVTRNWLRYYADPVTRRLLGSRLVNFLDHNDWLAPRAISEEDIAFLRDVYLPRREALEGLLGRDLSFWKYGG